MQEPLRVVKLALRRLLGQRKAHSNTAQKVITRMSVFLHEEDLPDGVLQGSNAVAVDTETMGLHTLRDRLCLLQISDGHGDEHLVRFAPGSDYAAPNLRAILADPARLKLFHFARFDLAAIEHYLKVTAAPLFCTKIASRLTRTFTDRHGLKELVKELLGADISKQQQSSDWGGPVLSEAQKDYAASDVRFLHRLHAEFLIRLEREGRMDMAQVALVPHHSGEHEDQPDQVGDFPGPGAQ
jgi:ribonuclease D